MEFEVIETTMLLSTLGASLVGWAGEWLVRAWRQSRPRQILPPPSPLCERECFKQAQ